MIAVATMPDDWGSAWMALPVLLLLALHLEPRIKRWRADRYERQFLRAWREQCKALAPTSPRVLRP